MESTNTHITVVKDVFPKHAGSIETLYNRNTDFRVLCEDYHLCIQYLYKFHKDFSEQMDILAEYEGLRKDLEKELMVFIQRFNDGRLKL